MNKTRFSELKEDAVPLAVLLILPLLYLKGALFFTDNILGSPFTDIKGEAYGKIFNYRETFSFPLWNPFVWGGTPNIGSPSAAFFYPFHWISTFLPINYAVNWNIALHLFLSEIFTYYLLRNYGANRPASMAAGIIYAFSAPQIMHIYAGHLIAITSMPWTPLMLLSLDKVLRIGDLRYGVLLSIVIALQLLAGYPQYQFYSLIAISFYWLFMMINLFLRGNGWGEIGKKSLFFVLFIFLGMVVSAIQIFPTSEFISYSTRENLSYDFVSIFSFPPENLITLLTPTFFGDMLNVPYWGKNNMWEMTAYVGILPLLLTLIALFYSGRRVVWFFAGLTIVSIILSMGKYTPLLKFLYHYIPGFNLFRGNSKFIFLTALSLSVLSGFGLDALMKGHDNKRRTGLSILAPGLLLLTGLFVVYFALDGAWFREAINKAASSPDMYSDPRPFMQKGFEYLAMMNFRKGLIWTSGLLISGVTLLLLYSYGKIKKNVALFAVFALIVFDLFTFGTRYMITFDLKDTYLDQEVITFLKRDREPFRVIAPNMDANIGMSSGIETLNGYGNMMIKRYSEFINVAQGNPPDTSILYVNINSINKLTDLLNAKYIVLESSQTLNNPAFIPVFDNSRYRIYKDVNALPRAFVVHAVKVLEGRDNIFRELVNAEFSPLSVTITEEKIAGPLNRTDHRSPFPRFVEYSANRVIVEADITEPGLLVLGDVYCPGWKAYVDGKEAKIYKANYVMRGVALPGGRHKVEFRYEPLSFKIGAMISITTVAFMVGFIVWDWRRSRNKSSI